MRVWHFKFHCIPAFCMALLVCSIPTAAQNQNQDSIKPTSAPEEHKKGFGEKAARYYDKWLQEDVCWIITDEELSAWKKLATNEERDLLIAAFWLRRNPHPDSLQNEFKEEHYRRIAYANAHFATALPGWRTDRGKIYIIYGPPDSIESRAEGGPVNPAEERNGDSKAYPFIIWRYRHLQGIGDGR